jgi:hypothetical protein
VFCDFENRVYTHVCPGSNETLTISCQFSFRGWINTTCPYVSYEPEVFAVVPADFTATNFSAYQLGFRGYQAQNDALLLAAGSETSSSSVLVGANTYFCENSNYSASTVQTSCDLSRLFSFAAAPSSTLFGVSSSENSLTAQSQLLSVEILSLTKYTSFAATQTKSLGTAAPTMRPTTPSEANPNANRAGLADVLNGSVKNSIYLTYFFILLLFLLVTLCYCFISNRDRYLLHALKALDNSE